MRECEPEELEARLEEVNDDPEIHGEGNVFCLKHCVIMDGLFLFVCHNYRLISLKGQKGVSKYTHVLSAAWLRASLLVGHELAEST